MARKKQLSLAAAETKLRGAVEQRVWGDWFLNVLESLPAGVDAALLDAALDGYLDKGRLIDLRGIPAVEDAVVRYAERHEHGLPHAAFVTVALRTGRGPIGPRLHDLLEHTVWTTPHRDAIRTMIGARPEIVEGARAAEAIGDPSNRTSPYLTILAIDSSSDSLDILLPRFEAARTSRDDSLDWLREHVVPLLGDTAAARAVIAMLDEAAGERAEVSPIWAFLAGLGIPKPPPVVRFTVTFRDRSQQPTLVVTVDSAKAVWMHGFRKGWHDGPITPADIASKLGWQPGDFVVRTSPGLDRAAIERWVQSLMPARD